MTIPDDDLPDPRTAELLRGARREIAPARDLWPGIEGRLRRKGAGTQRRRWTVGLAAAAGVILALWIFRPRPPAPSLASESAEMQQTLIESTGPRSSTAHSLAKHLSILDSAIQETEAALRENRGDPALIDLLQTLQRRRLALLAQAAHYAAES